MMDASYICAQPFLRAPRSSCLPEALYTDLKFSVKWHLAVGAVVSCAQGCSWEQGLRSGSCPLCERAGEGASFQCEQQRSPTR